MTSRISTALALTFFFGVLALVLWFGLPDSSITDRGNRIFVATTIYPLADFTEQVGGNWVEVNNVVPAGSEPHDYEPSPRDVTRVLESDVLISIGSGLDDWAQEFADEITAQGGQTLRLEDTVDVYESDPHIWLDPVLAQDIVLDIRDVLIVADPEHARDYEANADAYVQALMSLHDDYLSSLSDCELDDIIVSHDAMGYVARRYGFEAHGISGLSPEAEPSVRDLARLAEDARDLGIKTIFFETLVSPELAETLAAEVGAETAVLNPLEGLSPEELAAGDNYLSVMQNNRVALSSALVCQ